MKILQVCPYDLRRHGGVQRHVLDLTAALRQAGHDVRVIAPGAQDLPFAVAQRSVRLYGTAFDVSWVAGADIPGLERCLAEAAFDVVHLQAPWSPFLPLQVLRRVRGGPACCIATFHDMPPPTLLGASTRAFYRPLSRWLSRRLDAAIAVSPAPAGHLRLAPDCALHELPGCIDLSALRALAGGRADRSRGARLLYVGRLEPRKGVDVLIDAFARLLAARPDARLAIVGDGDERAALQAQARRLGVAAQVEFAGAIDEEGKRAQLAGADLLCAPSRYGESYGLVLVEAMAAGLPVVAADNAGYRNVLTRAGADGLVPAGDAGALAAKLGALLADPAACARLAAWGREASLRADVGVRLGEFLAIYAAARSKRDGAGR